MAKLVGTSMKRREDPRFIQGKGSYVANISLPNMAYLAIKRSPYGHAKIKTINTKKAKALPGVIAVFTGQDLIDGGVGKLPCGCASWRKNEPHPGFPLREHYGPATIGPEQFTIIVRKNNGMATHFACGEDVTTISL